jgi:hypothetical protein
MSVHGIFISILGTALIESTPRMKYDSKVEKSHSIGELKSDPITSHSVKLNAVAKIIIKLEIDEIYKKNNHEIRILIDMVMVKQFVAITFQLITTMEMLILTLIHDNAWFTYRVSANAYSLAFCCSVCHPKINI